MKSLMLFLQKVLHDVENWCCTSTSRDYQTIAARVEHEGLSFLTITLAEFGKDFEKSLDQGSVGPNQFRKFSKTGALPRLFGGLLDQVFDRGTGRLLPEPSVTAIWAVRQVTLMYAKMKLRCTPAREAAAIKQFLECEKDVRNSDAAMDPEILGRYRRIGVLLWADIFSKLDLSVYLGEIVPGHGPGATADRRLGNQKWENREWTRRLDSVFPVVNYLLPNPRYHSDLADVTILEPGQEEPVRVTLVPKTLKTPRVIAIEPTCMQYVQQGLMRKWRELVDRDDFLSQLIGTNDQTPNQHLAREGSRKGHLATIDMSEASDRVSNQHVRVLLQNHPHLFEAVDSCRSRKADVPGHGVIRLAKFASMGSGLTFDMEEIVFATIIFTAIEEDLNRPLTRRDFISYRGQVRVYGDDIVVPVKHVRSVVSHLEAFGLKVNLNKSFWTGGFRESCGKEYFDGQDVSIVRVRTVFPTDRQHGAEIVSTVSLRNQLYHAGLWQAVRYLDDMLGRLIPTPRVLPTSPVLGRNSFLGYEIQRSCSKLHRPLVKGLRVRPIIPKSEIDGVAALLKVLVTDGATPNPDPKHLSRAGRPKRVNTELGWGTPY